MFQNAINPSSAVGVTTASPRSLTVDSVTGQLGSSISAPSSASPLFVATLSANQANVTGNGTFYNVVFNTPLLANASYNTGTGVFTVPTTGTYILQFLLRLSNLTTAHNSGQVQLIGTPALSILANYGAMQDVPSASYVINSSQTLFLTASTTINVQLYVSGSTQTVGLVGGANYNSYFSGIFIG